MGQFSFFAQFRHQYAADNGDNDQEHCHQGEDYGIVRAHKIGHNHGHYETADAHGGVVHAAGRAYVLGPEFAGQRQQGDAGHVYADRAGNDDAARSHEHISQRAGGQHIGQVEKHCAAHADNDIGKIIPSHVGNDNT